MAQTLPHPVPSAQMAQKKLSFLFGAAIDLLGIPVTMLLSFIMVPLYLNHITTADFGYWSTTLEMAQFASLLWISVDYYLIQTVSGKADDPEALKRGVSEAALVVLGWVSLCFLGLGALLVVFPEWLESVQFNLFAGLLGLVALWAVLRSMRHLLTSCLIGQNRMPLVNALAILGTTGFQVLPWVYMQFGFGILSFGFGYLSTFAVLMLVELWVIGPFVFSHFSLGALSPGGLAQLFRFSFQSFTSKLSQHLYTYVNVFAIAQLMGAASVAVYVFSLKLANFSKFIVPRIVAIGYPSYARLLAEGNQERMSQVLLKLFRFSLRSGLFLAATILLLNGIFVNHWVGPGQYAGPVFTLLAALFCLRESLVAAFYQVVYATQEIRWANRVIVFEALLSLILAFTFGKIWGITGVLGATLLSTGTASAVYLFYKGLKLAGLPAARLLASAAPVLLKSLPSLGLLYFGARWLEQGFSWLGLVGVVALSGTVNLLFFEARLLFELRHLKLKEMLLEIIERS